MTGWAVVGENACFFLRYVCLSVGNDFFFLLLIDLSLLYLHA
jgi:hypothetical protein